MAAIHTNTDMLRNAREEGTAIIAEVFGEIDLNRSPDLRGDLMLVLDGRKPAKLVLNCQQVPYMDSSAIAVLVETLQKLRPHKGQVFLTNLQPRVKGLLEIARLESIFKLVDSVETAMK
jgi:anti-sigma B factor antagonist